MSNINAAQLSSKYGFDFINGREVPRLVVTDGYILAGLHQGGVHVETGELTLAGTLQGSLDAQSGTRVCIRGRQQGSVSVASGAVVVVAGAIEGSVHVRRGGQVIIEAGGRLAGSLTNYGEVIVRGVFGGSYIGDGDMKLENDGYIKQPVIRDGARYYEW